MKIDTSSYNLSVAMYIQRKFKDNAKYFPEIIEEVNLQLILQDLNHGLTLIEGSRYKYGEHIILDISANKISWYAYQSQQNETIIGYSLEKGLITPVPGNNFAEERRNIAYVESVIDNRQHLSRIKVIMDDDIVYVSYPRDVLFPDRKWVYCFKNEAINMYEDIEQIQKEMLGNILRLVSSSSNKIKSTHYGPQI